MNPIIDGLNPEQLAGVTAPDGPIQVVAGAGTGKTRVLTHRIAYLIDMGKATPDQILAVTFTNKASIEMRERLANLIGPKQAELAWIGTFHSMSREILRQHPTAAGLRNADYMLLDEEDQAKTIEGVADALGLLPKIGTRDKSIGRAEKLNRLSRIVLGWKEDGLTPRAIENLPHLSARSEDTAQAFDLYKAYQQTLQTRNTCDFSDLILRVNEMFHNDPMVHQRWKNKFRYVLVDEFQDTNRLQYSWLKYLAGEHKNIFTVGDGDQSIYQWRGARPEIMKNFAKDWEGGVKIVLHRNYRSTQNILDVANRIVSHNVRADKKTLSSNRTGQTVKFAAYSTHDEEAKEIAKDIKNRLAAGVSPNSIAILFRGAAQMDVFEHKLAAENIPYEVVGGKRFYSREEIKDALSYLRIAVDPTDSMAFQRIFNKPSRAIDEPAVDFVLETHRLTNGTRPIYVSCREVAEEQDRLPGKVRQGLKDFADMLEDFSNAAKDPEARPGALIEEMLERVGYITWRVSIGDQEVNDREENIRAMIEDANNYDHAHDYMQASMLAQTVTEDNASPKVRLGTIHASKGLEYDVVYTPCLEEGILPNKRSLQEKYGLEEERRLAHVAWTRAKSNLIISCAAQRKFANTRPSVFLEEAELTLPGTARAIVSMVKPEQSRLKIKTFGVKKTQNER